MPNKLNNETSPYLLQHKDNPVNWFPWSSESLFIEILSTVYVDEQLKNYFKFKIDHTLDWIDEILIFKSGDNCCYFSSIDADSEGVEGKYYTWDYFELKNILNRLIHTNHSKLNNEYSKFNISLLKKIKQKKTKESPLKLIKKY